MHIEWPQVRVVILNDRKSGYRPDRAAIKKLVNHLPTAKVIGFKLYYEGFWAILVECDKFYPIYMGNLQMVAMTDLLKNNFTQLPPDYPPLKPVS